MRGLALALVVVLAACAPPDDETGVPETSPRQQPSVTTPGITLSGDINIGVKRGF